LRALDTAGKHRFPLHEGPDEQMWVRQPSSFAGETSQHLIGIGKRPHEPRRPGQLWRQRLGMKCAVSRQRFNLAARGFRCNGTALFHPGNRITVYFNNLEISEIVELSVSGQTRGIRRMLMNLLRLGLTGRPKTRSEQPLCNRNHVARQDNKARFTRVRCQLAKIHLVNV
jgi:hypothetical protein